MIDKVEGRSTIGTRAKAPKPALRAIGRRALRSGKRVAGSRNDRAQPDPQTGLESTVSLSADGERRYRDPLAVARCAATWKWTRQQVIDSIKSDSNTFFTLVNGTCAEVGVVNGPKGDYVRTHADGCWNDNLLALAECG
jgi:hypothetical protein